MTVCLPLCSWYHHSRSKKSPLAITSPSTMIPAALSIPPIIFSLLGLSFGLALSLPPFQKVEVLRDVLALAPASKMFQIGLLLWNVLGMMKKLYLLLHVRWRQDLPAKLAQTHR